MKNSIVCVFMIVLLVISACTEKVDIEREKTQVKAVLDQLIQASEAEDMELFSRIYAQDSDMVNFGTDSSERIVGWEKLKEVMQNQFAATGSSELLVKDQVIKIHDSGKVAWFSEIIDWNIVSQDQAIELKGLRATGVLEQREEGWVIVQLHYSLPSDGQPVQD